MAEEKMILAGSNIGKSFEKTKILENVNLTLETGTSLVITGASGIGKSTLLSIMGLLLKPDCGELTLNGKDLLGLKDKELSGARNTHFGFLFQNTQLIGSLTILDNVLVPLLIAGKKPDRAYASGLLEKVGLAERMNYYPHQLSIGQKRRAALVRSLITHPTFILADEQTNDLDPENVKLVSDFLFSSVDEKTGLLLVTHDRELAARAEKEIRL